MSSFILSPRGEGRAKGDSRKCNNCYFVCINTGTGRRGAVNRGQGTGDRSQETGDRLPFCYNYVITCAGRSHA
jgi:hypothetical protein